MLLHNIRIMVSDVDCGLYAQVFQFTAVEAFPIFIMEGSDIVVVCAINSPASIGHSQSVSWLS